MRLLFLILFFIFSLGAMQEKHSLAREILMKEFTLATFNDKSNEIIEQIDIVLDQLNASGRPVSDDDEMFTEAETLQCRLEALFDEFSLHCGPSSEEYQLYGKKDNDDSRKSSN